MRLSVVIPAHAPHRDRLRRTLAGLAAQTLPAGDWEVLLVDNASMPPLAPADWAVDGLNLRLVSEPALGLSHARRRGFLEARGEIVVLVDDDNVLDPGYLAHVLATFAREPDLGAVGGNVRPEFEVPPAAWVAPFQGLLALRDLGPEPARARWPAGVAREYPRCAPIGAGLALRRVVALDYAAALDRDPVRRQLDRTGSQLISGGDNDLVMHVLEAGLAVGYEPALALVHLIPARRVQRAYLGALNRAIARSWVRVLALHGIRPWPAIAPASVRLRQARAWLRTRPWRDDAAWVTWQGLCGTFEGQADLTRKPPEPASGSR